MIKVGEVEQDSDLYYVYKIEGEEFHCIVEPKYLVSLEKSIYYEDNMLMGNIVRKIVPNNVLSRKVYPDAVVDGDFLFIHPEGQVDHIEEFVQKCKEFIKEQGL